MTIPLPPPRLTRVAEATPPAAEQLAERLRRQLVNGLHMGALGPGDRLPSIRSVARETGVDHRAVAQAYRTLEEEGLVEVRGRSGVCVPRSPRSERGATPRETGGWMAQVLAESWRRNLSTTELCYLVESCTDASSLRCACVESNADQMTAYCTEVQALSGMTMVPAYVAADARETVADPGERDRLRALLETAQMVITTHHHVAAVRSVLGDPEVPVLILRINPALAEAVRRQLRERGMTVVAATLEFGERLRLMYADAIERDDQLKVVLADDAEGLRRIDPSEPILLTRAACERCPEIRHPTLVFPHSPTLAAETVRELSEAVVRLNMVAVAPQA